MRVKSDLKEETGTAKAVPVFMLRNSIKIYNIELFSVIFYREKLLRFY